MYVFVTVPHTTVHQDQPPAMYPEYIGKKDS